MRFLIYLSLMFFAVLSSCGRIKEKGDAVVNKTKQTIHKVGDKIETITEQVVDKTLPSYDSYTPDTDNNKKRFKEHIGIEPAQDVKNIYAYGDFLGADYKVLISFSCNSKTVAKIIQSKHMILTTDILDDGLGFGEEFKWWDKSKIRTIKPYKEGKEGEYWKYIWYDKESEMAYYEEFSL